MTENPKKYVFVGTSGQYGELGFTAVGQTCLLIDSGYVEGVKGGLALIPKASYDRFQFTQEEVRKWGPNGSHSMGNEAFLSKLRAARDEFIRIRGEILSGASVKEAVMKNVVRS